ncbi:hypothetical protein AMTR_s00400p00013390, partial [Amborella trichopoda]
MQSLWDKTLQVVAWRLHTESIVKQAADDQYWKSWNCQNLSPEFELKRENNESESGVHMDRQIQSLHSLYNTMNSQLTVAERLADILSDQMSALNIEAPSVKRRNAAKELFESIGLTGGSDLFKSPEVKESEHSSYASKKFSSSSFSSTKESPPRKLSSAQLFEPQTARRRRNSMEKSWINVEPPKTTIKRTPREEPSSDKLSLEKLPNLRNRVGFSPSRQKEFTPPARPLFASSPDKGYAVVNGFRRCHLSMRLARRHLDPRPHFSNGQTSEPLQIAQLISPKTQGLPETIPQASTPSSSSTGAQAVSPPGFSDGKNISITRKEHTGFSSSQAIMATKTQSITQPKGASPIKQLFPFNTALSSTSEPMRNTMHAKDQADGFLAPMSIETTVTPKLMPASAKHEAAEPEKIPTVPMKNTFEQKDQTLADSAKHKPVKLEDFHAVSVGKPISPPVSVSSDSALSPPVLALIPPFSVSPGSSLAPLSSPLFFKHLQTTDNPLITSGLTGANTTVTGLSFDCPSSTVPPNLGFVASSGPGLISSPSSTNGFSNTITSTLVNLSSPAPIVPAVSATPKIAQPIPTNAIQPLADMKNETLDATILEEDGMEEEAPDPTNDMSLGSFAIQACVFYPTLNLTPQPDFSSPSESGAPPTMSAFGRPSQIGLGVSAFGQPAQIGSGASPFGQPSLLRQLGSGLPGAGFSSSSSSGSASSVGGFAAMATAGDGFGAMASGGG